MDLATKVGPSSHSLSFWTLASLGVSKLGLLLAHQALIGVRHRSSGCRGPLVILWMLTRFASGTSMGGCCINECESIYIYIYILLYIYIYCYKYMCVCISAYLHMSHLYLYLHKGFHAYLGACTSFGAEMVKATYRERGKQLQPSFQRCW